MHMAYGEEPTPPRTCAAGAVQESTDCGKREETVVIIPSLSNGGGGTKTSGSSPSGSNTKYVSYNRLTTGPDGTPCLTTGYSEEGVIPNDLAPDPNQNRTQVLSGNNLTGQYPPCPQQPPAPGQSATPETRTMIAMRAWEQRVPLPKPRPVIAPGRAITGKLAYLETRGQLSQNYTEDTVFGTLRITARGSYTIAWGDGATTGPHGFEGLPWPSGQITHDYLDVGAYDIVVTEKWTATWSLDGESGVLRTLQTTGRIDNFPVEQIQAVIGR